MHKPLQPQPPAWLTLTCCWLIVFTAVIAALWVGN